LVINLLFSYFLTDLREQLKQIEKSVLTKEPRFVFRVLRSLPNTRRKLNSLVLRRIIHSSYANAPKERDNLLNIVGGEDNGFLEAASPFQQRSGRILKQGAVSPLPEVC
jgi:26S proteasome regulatory subunit N3